MIDTHCHLYLDEFKDDITAVLQRAKEKNITKILLPAIDSKTHDAMIQIAEQHPLTLMAMIGLHPCSVTENYKEELACIEQWLQKRPFIAIGEIGLDFYWSKEYIQQQYEAFKQQIEWAIDKNIPIAIHGRDATTECIECIQPYIKKGLRGVFHCFSGTQEDVKKIVDANFYIGIGGVVTFKNSTLRNIIKDIPLSNILLETDAPYLAPTPYRGKRNEPSYLSYIAETIASLSHQSIEEVIHQTTENACHLFKYW